MQKKLIKSIYLNGSVFDFYSSKEGIYVNKDNSKTCNPHNNMRDAIRWMYDISEFGS